MLQKVKLEKLNYSLFTKLLRKSSFKISTPLTSFYQRKNRDECWELPEMCCASGSPARSLDKHLEVLKLWWLQQNPSTANRGLASWKPSANQEAGPERTGGPGRRVESGRKGGRKERSEQKRSILTSVGQEERRRRILFRTFWAGIPNRAELTRLSLWTEKGKKVEVGNGRTLTPFLNFTEVLSPLFNHWNKMMGC